MTITFGEIGNFISDNLIWFLIPIIVFILTMFVILLVKVIKSKKGREKHERKRQNKVSRPR